MARILIHIHTGPADANKATLACTVAATAIRAEHEVAVFFAGDGVHCLAAAHADVTGKGTGRLGDHLAALRDGGARLFASGKSAEARGYDRSLIEPHGAEFAMPDRLIALTVECDRVLCY